MTHPETQVASYFARYDSTTAPLGRALRLRLQVRLPGFFEVVYLYENQDTLLISYSPSERGYEGVCSLSVQRNRVLLYFTRGAELTGADPKKLLQGRASVRYVEIREPQELDRPEIEGLLVAALELAGVRPDPHAVGGVIVRAEAQKQRRARAASR